MTSGNCDGDANLQTYLLFAADCRPEAPKMGASSEMDVREKSLLESAESAGWLPSYAVEELREMQHSFDAFVNFNGFGESTEKD